MDQEPQAPGGRGSIGREIFEQVEQLLATESINRSEAFQRISDETGRRAGTVAANYYRIARQHGRGRPRRGGGPRGGAGPGRPRGRRRAGGDAQDALTRAQQALEELSAIVARQEGELAAMRSQTEQLEELRKWMSKNVR